MEPILKAYIYEAIEAEKAGLKVNFKKNPEPIPEEFQNKLDEIPALKTAFDAQNTRGLLPKLPGNSFTDFRHQRWTRKIRFRQRRAKSVGHEN